MRDVSLFSGRDTPVVFGHRGYSAKAPENTMEAFALCAEQGVSGIELDIHLCSTGELVVTHDFNVRRVTGFDGIVEQMGYREIRTLDAGSHKGPSHAGAYIPLLEELFTRFGDTFVYDIELKQESWQDTGLASALWELMRRHSIEGSCMVSSFNPFAVRSFRKASGGSIPTAVIYCVSDDVPKILHHGKGRLIAGCDMLKPHYPQITDDLFARDHDRKGYPLVTWTVDDEEEIRRLTRLGVEGIISNDPGKTLAITSACR